MEYQIEFVGVDTLSLYRRLYWYMSRRSRMINLAIFAVAAVWALSAYRQSASVTYLILFVVYILMAVWWYLRPLRIANKAYKSALKFHDGMMPPTTVRFGDEIVLQDVNTSSVIPYSKIVKVQFIENGIMIRLKEDRVYFSAIDQFTRGSLPELKQFLQSKRPDLKIPK